MFVWGRLPYDLVVLGALLVGIALRIVQAVFRYRIYAPLRDDPELFRTMQVTDDGFAVAWDSDDLDMASTTVAELADQAGRRLGVRQAQRLHARRCGGRSRPRPAARRLSRQGP